MAANTKYQPAPQRDSLEESSYAQPPPSYQQDDHAALLGAPRSEDDNLPDDFKASVFKQDIHRRTFIRKVYAILTVQLFATAIASSISFYSAAYKSWIQNNPWMMYLGLFGAIGFMLLTFWKRKSYPTNLIFLSAFTAMEAYCISVVTSFYDSKIVIEALVFTLGIFVALTLFACQSNGYILVDTQLVMRHYHVEEEIAASISLYLDIINLFLAILRILNSQQNN
ncbi:hypothetical protein BLS_004197 [Venturia inaequalis]|uniref:Uncharacterized protein n=1 Tax=Venturia inaequalis TaxID=5025 RepID=A0A8H3YW71_VENIN|nr:hypothetical protein BLS_004197 [Venturia inaequalis]